MKFDRHSLVRWFVCLVIAVGLAIGVGFLLILVVAITSFPREVTDLDDYEPLLDKWSLTGLTAHFPPSVPPGARKARLSARPGFLQGGAHLQLYTLVSPKDAAAADARYASAATHTFHGGDRSDHINQPDGVPTTDFYTSGSKDTTFDSSFTIYVLSAKPAAVSNSGDFQWNHGQSCGVAVSTRRNEVVYWAESW